MLKFTATLPAITSRARVAATKQLPTWTQSCCRRLTNTASPYRHEGAHQRSFSPPINIMMGAGLSLLATTFLLDGGSFNTASCEQVKHGDSVSFQVMTALEKNDEIQRIRCAQILHDLHELAQEEPRLKRGKTVRKMWKLIKRKTGFASSSTSDENEKDEEGGPLQRRKTKKGEISLRNVDLRQLSPEKAQELIGRLSGGDRFNEDSLEYLLHTSEAILRKDPTLLDLTDRTGKIAVVGDLHGSLYSLQHILEVIGPIGGEDAKTVVFDGDFVDRGSESLEVICILLLLKLAHPQDVILLRGNHEDVLVASAYGFHDELIEKYGDEAMDTIWNSVSAVFCALPLGAVTKTAAILHGGIPSKEFKLKDLEAITTEQRCRIKTTMRSSMQTEIETLVQGILWSDPSKRKGIRPNTARTVGVFFGPDVSRDFLIEHNLKYLIRGHEVAENGISTVSLGDDHSVVTVFSQPAYPDGLGTNKGAVLELDADGNYHTVEFTHCDPPLLNPQEIKANDNRVIQDLRALLDSRIGKVEEAFRALAPDGMISTKHWMNTMEEVLELPGAPWPDLIPKLVPKSARRQEGYVDWRIFLKTRGDGTDRVIQNLRANHRMLMTVFNFLDFNGDGTLNKEEFTAGITLLNKRLPQDRQLHAEELYDRMDLNHCGEVDLEDFSRMFNTVK